MHERTAHSISQQPRRHLESDCLISGGWNPAAPTATASHTDVLGCCAMLQALCLLRCRSLRLLRRHSLRRRRFICLQHGDCKRMAASSTRLQHGPRLTCSRLRCRFNLNMT